MATRRDTWNSVTQAGAAAANALTSAGASAANAAADAGASYAGGTLSLTSNLKLADNKVLALGNDVDATLGYNTTSDGLAIGLTDNKATALSIGVGATSYAKVVTTTGSQKVHSLKELAMNSQKVTGLAAADTAGDAGRYEQLGGSDVRAYTQHTHEITLADMQGKGAVTFATFTMRVMDARDSIIWAWYQNAGGIFTSSGTLSGVYPSIGRSDDPDSIYIERDIKAAYAIEDDNSNHGADFAAYAEMGDKLVIGAGGDASTYYGKSYTLVCKVTLTGGSTMAQLTGGGPIYCHLVLARVDTTQVEGVT